MTPNFFTILAFVLLVAFAFYYFTSDGPVTNQGAVNLYQTEMPPSPNENVNTNLVNSNLEFVPPLSTVKKVQFNESPPVQVENVNRVAEIEAMIYPKFSNDFAPKLCPIDAPAFRQPAADVRLNLNCYPRDSIIADDLKPRLDANNAWTKMNPANPGSLTDKNFLEAGYMIGINTQGSSLKNPNLSLRADPPIPRAPVAWTGGISTIEPDLLRKNLGI